MDLIEILKKRSPALPVAPLAGYPGTALTGTSARENLVDAQTQFETVSAIYEKWKPDMVFPFMDLSVEAESLGLEIRFNENDAPDVVTHPIGNVSDLDNLQAPGATGARLGVFTETIRLLKKVADACVCGYCSSPFTLSGLLAGAEELTINTIMDPDFCKRLLEFSTEVIIPYVKAQEKAGADAVMLLEPTAALLSPGMFTEFVNPYINAIADEVDLPLILHVCGNTTHLVNSMCKADISGLSLDSMVDLAAVSKDVPRDMALLGNVSPVETMLDGTPEQVYASTHSLLESMDDFSSFVLSTGCDLPTKTPIENIESFFKAASDYKQGL